MRKMYIQPKSEITKVAPRTIVCTSTPNGGNTEGNITPGTEGDAPRRRRTKVF